MLTLPGLYGSGPEHWQSRWEALHGCVRVEQADWARPQLAVWRERLLAALAAEAEPVVVVAHSLGCALLVHTVLGAPEARAKVAGALLVAPADVDDVARVPPETRSFAPLPLGAVGFPALLVASRDDPFLTFERAGELADGWGATLVDAGSTGHINAESGLGDWDEGFRLVSALRR